MTKGRRGRERGRRPRRPERAFGSDLGDPTAAPTPLPVDPAVGHVPVLVEPILELLAPEPGQTVVDLTVGRGGHAMLLAERVGRSGTVIGVDLDADNLAFAEARVTKTHRCRFVGLHGPFSEAPQRLRDLGLCADAVLADLGFASTQIDEPDRGLSFAADGPLDMRFDRTAPRTAADLLDSLPERELGEMLRHLGEEPLAAKIARAIVRLRKSGQLPQTTTGLATLVADVYGPRAAKSRLHPATRTFMALRIAVNDELNHLARLLEEVERAAVDSPPALDPGGDSGGAPGSRWLHPAARIAIVSFHSLEDRIVKHRFAALAKAKLAHALTRKPLIADDTEVAANPRSRSAKLRAIRLDAKARTADNPRREAARQRRS